MGGGAVLHVARAERGHGDMDKQSHCKFRDLLRASSQREGGRSPASPVMALVSDGDNVPY